MADCFYRMGQEIYIYTYNYIYTHTYVLNKYVYIYTHINIGYPFVYGYPETIFAAQLKLLSDLSSTIRA